MCNVAADEYIEIRKKIEEAERKKWADWIGNKLPLKHPLYANILWAIAEAMERNDFEWVCKRGYNLYKRELTRRGDICRI